MGRIDESSRRRFEASRRAGEATPISAFLPEPHDVTYHATLEELVLIDMEFRWKAWRESPKGERPPSLSDYQARHPHLAAARTRERLEAELQWLARSAEPDGETRIDRYTLEEHIGTGAFADVWRAHDPKLGRDVALKIPNSIATAEERLLERVHREAHAAGSLDHPGVLSVHAIGEHEGRPFYVSEYVPGQTLGVQFRAGPMKPDELATIVAAIARAAAYAHEHGVIHRDIKPSNILMHPVRGPVLADFGLAHLGESASALTQEGEVLGTPAYMAPEQATGRLQDIGARTDVYALGVVLYEGLTGTIPFKRDSSAATIQALLSSDPEPPSVRKPGVPLDLETICLKAMAREPDRRYASAEQLALDLERFVARKPVSARRTGPLGRVALWMRRRPAFAGMAAAALIAVAVVATWGYLGIRAERDQLQAERDKTKQSLYRALLSDARSIVEAGRAGWPERAQERLREAAGIHVETDPLPLRDLAIRCATPVGPTLSLVASWARPNERTRALCLDAAGLRAFEVTEAGELRIRSLRDGAILARAPTEADGLQRIVLHPHDALLVLAFEAGILETWSIEPLTRLVRTTTSPLETVALHPRGSLLACAHPTGEVTIHEWQGQARGPHVRTLEAHPGRCRDLAFSPDGHWLVTGGAGNSLKLWDWRRGVCVQDCNTIAAPPLVVACQSTTEDRRPRFAGATAVDFTPKQAEPGHVDIPQNIDWSHGARIVQMAYVSGWLISVSADGSMAVWNADTRKHILSETGSRGRVAAAAVHDDRREIVTAHTDGTLARWRIDGGLAQQWATHHGCAFRPGTLELFTDSGLLHHDAPRARSEPFRATSHVALLRDSPTTLLAIEPSGTVIQFDAAPPHRELGRWETGLRDVSMACRHGETIAMATTGGRLWLGTIGAAGVDGRTLDVGHGPIHDLCADPRLPGGFQGLDRAGRFRVVGNRPVERLEAQGARTERLASGGTRLVVWSRERGLALEEDGRVVILDTPSDRPDHLAISSDGAWLVCCGGAGTTIRRLPSGAVHDTLSSNYRRAWFSSDDKYLMVSGPLKVFEIEPRRWHAHSTLYATSAVATDAAMTRLLISDTRSGLWTWPMDDVVGAGVETVGAADLLGPGLPVTDGAHAMSTWGLDISPDGRRMATCDHFGFVKLWDLETRRSTKTVRPKPGLAWTVAFAPDGREVAVGVSKDVLILDAAAGQERTRLEGHGRLVVGLAFHPTEPWLVSCALDRTLRVWDLARGTLVHTHKVAAVPRSLAMAPDGENLAISYEDGRVEVVPTRERLASLTPRYTLQSHPTETYIVAYDPSGTMLASGGADGRVVLHDAASGDRLCTLSSTRNVRSLSFSDDGRFLAAGSYVAPSTSWDLRAIRAMLAELGVDWSTNAGRR